MKDTACTLSLIHMAMTPRGQTCPPDLGRWTTRLGTDGSPGPRARGCEPISGRAARQLSPPTSSVDVVDRSDHHELFNNTVDRFLFF